MITEGIYSPLSKSVLKKQKNKNTHTHTPHKTIEKDICKSLRSTR